MSTNPKSFRLTQKAQENLSKLGDKYELSEGRIINLLLTEKHFGSGMDFGKLAADIILIRYFHNKAVEVGIEDH